MAKDTSASGSRAGYHFQDLFALEKISEFLTIRSYSEKIIIEKRDAPHIDDVVINTHKTVQYYQLKHSDQDNTHFTNSSLFGRTQNGESLFQKTFEGWKKVQNIELQN